MPKKLGMKKYVHPFCPKKTKKVKDIAKKSRKFLKSSRGSYKELYVLWTLVVTML